VALAPLVIDEASVGVARDGTSGQQDEGCVLLLLMGHGSSHRLVRVGETDLEPVEPYHVLLLLAGMGEGGLEDDGQVNTGGQSCQGR